MGGGGLLAESESTKKIYVGCMKLFLKILKDGEIDAEVGEEDPVPFIKGGPKFQHPWPVCENRNSAGGEKLISDYPRE